MDLMTGYNAFYVILALIGVVLIFIGGVWFERRYTPIALAAVDKALKEGLAELQAWKEDAKVDLGISHVRIQSTANALGALATTVEGHADKMIVSAQGMAQAADSMVQAVQAKAATPPAPDPAKVPAEPGSIKQTVEASAQPEQPPAA